MRRYVIIFLALLITLRAALALPLVNPYRFAAGVADPDLFIGVFTSGTGSNSSHTHTWPPGWTEFVGETLFASNVGALSAAYRVEDGTEGSSITVETSNSQYGSWVMYRIEGWAGTPEGASVALATGTDPDPPSITPSGGSQAYLFIAAAGYDYDSGTRPMSTAPTNYGSLITAEANRSGTATAVRALTASSEDPGTFDQTSPDKGGATTIAVDPESAGVNPTVKNTDNGTTASGTEHVLNIPPES